MRLDRFLAETGFGTRSEVKKLIKSKSVTINGELATKPDMHLDENTDSVFVNNKKVNYRKFIYLMLNKPDSYVSATGRYVPKINPDRQDIQDIIRWQYTHR